MLKTCNNTQHEAPSTRTQIPEISPEGFAPSKTPTAGKTKTSIFNRAKQMITRAQTRSPRGHRSPASAKRGMLYTPSIATAGNSNIPSVFAHVYDKVRAIPQKLQRKKSFENIRVHFLGAILRGKKSQSGSSTTRIGLSEQDTIALSNRDSLSGRGTPTRSNILVPIDYSPRGIILRQTKFTPPDPLRSHPPFDTPGRRISNPRRREGVHKTMRKKYVRRLYNMSILPVLEEVSEEENTDEENDLPSGRAARARSKPQDFGVSVPDEFDSGLILQDSLDLKEKIRVQQEEIEHLSHELHNMTSQQVVLADQLERLSKTLKAMEQALASLLTFANSRTAERVDAVMGPGDRDVAVRIAARHSRQDIGPTEDSHGDQGEKVPSLREQIAQQEQCIDHYKQMQAAARLKADKLANENDILKASLRKAQRERQDTGTLLETARERTRRLESRLLETERGL